MRIIPKDGLSPPPGSCRCVYKRIDADGNATEVWSRHLINNWAPAEVYVSSDPERVITVGEHGQQFHEYPELAVVVYGPRGRLLRVHDYEDLKLSEGHLDRPWAHWRKFKLSVWIEDGRYLVQRMHWGELLILDAMTAEVVDAPSAELKSTARSAVAERAVDLLDSKDTEDRKTGAYVCGKLKLRDAIPKLKALLKDEAYWISYGDNGEESRWYPVRTRAKEALEAMDVSIPDDTVMEEPADE